MERLRAGGDLQKLAAEVCLSKHAEALIALRNIADHLGIANTESKQKAELCQEINPLLDAELADITTLTDLVPEDKVLDMPRMRRSQFVDPRGNIILTPVVAADGLTYDLATIEAIAEDARAASGQAHSDTVVYYNNAYASLLSDMMQATSGINLPSYGGPRRIVCGHGASLNGDPQHLSGDGPVGDFTFHMHSLYDSTLRFIMVPFIAPDGFTYDLQTLYDYLATAKRSHQQTWRGMSGHNDIDAVVYYNAAWFAVLSAIVQDTFGIALPPYDGPRSLVLSEISPSSSGTRRSRTGNSNRSKTPPWCVSP